ncbi:hypothetical protein AGR7C_Cc170044 [Agrobacterium deltaense Zutra 3/1]|uniref:Uncharacterized protein n=1 Tax=Agrobacterium deltaense Zutra 3/1 TaxID=1183427 RepID=A0A1S7PSG3_9HYPH|nr:hypothetical protein AGR7C_Cc170044 [Agrobacterium deltaense Zutra 3/1]
MFSASELTLRCAKIRQTKNPGISAGVSITDLCQIRLERTLKANETGDFVVRTVFVVVVGGDLGGQTFGDLVVNRQTSSPSVAVANEVAVSRVDVQGAEVFKAGGKRQAIGCLDRVLNGNSPFRLCVVSVVARSPHTSKTEGARTDICEQHTADGNVFCIEVVAGDQVSRNSAKLSADHAADTNVVVSFILELTILAFQFVNRQRSLERTCVVGVLDRVEQGVGRQNVSFAVQIVIPPAVELTDLQAAEFDEGLIDVNAGATIVVAVAERAAAVSIAAEADETTQSAEFGVGAGVNFELGARERIPVGRAGRVTTEVGLETDVTAELQAGFGAGDVEEAGTESVADANIFQGLGLGSDDSVSGLCAGYCCESCSGADEKALDVHG